MIRLSDGRCQLALLISVLMLAALITGVSSRRRRPCETVCTRDCPFGYLNHGCPRCDCAPDPCANNYCPGGTTCVPTPVKNCGHRGGCPCEAVCVRGVCNDTCAHVQCEFGFKLKGCPRCECAPNPCASITCPTGNVCQTRKTRCPFREGCPHMGFCRPGVCEHTCNTNCEYGFLNQGCPRCQCAPNPCESTTCGPGEKCTAVAGTCNLAFGCPADGICVASVCDSTCAITCPYGFLPEGCPRCKCAPSPCQGMMCPGEFECHVQAPSTCNFPAGGCSFEAVCKPKVCEETCARQCIYGYKPKGCPRCDCATNPCDGVICPPDCVCFAEPGNCTSFTSCPYIPVCKLINCNDTCGIDCPYGFLSEGCPRCTCAPNPCDGMQCPVGMLCQPRKSDCKFHHHCPHTAECVPSTCEEFCNKNCPFGFKSNMCPRCECHNNPCRGVHCGTGMRCFAVDAPCTFERHCPNVFNCTPSVCSETCQKYCPYGFLEDGCPRCQCAPDPCLSLACGVNERCVTDPGTCVHGQCPHIGNCVPSVCAQTCEKYCPYGFLEEGCPRCQCAPDPCQNVACNGSERCATNPGTCVHGQCPHIGNCVPSVCAETCQNYCPYGFLEEGCPRCQCAPDPCQNVVCNGKERCVTVAGTCVYGQCPHIGNCVPSVCAETCQNFCPYGFLEEGCPRCRCAPDPCLNVACRGNERCVTNPGTCIYGQCPHIGNCVPSVCAETCQKYCPYGFLEEGCPRCQCAPDPCPSLTCGVNERCVTNPGTCVHGQCPHIGNCVASVCAETCDKYCPYGFLEDGCPRCQCTPDPCQTVTCIGNNRCVATPGTCVHGKCPHIGNCEPSVCPPVCSRHCPYGFLEKGCPRCTCAPNPCDINQCPGSEDCFTQEGLCVSGNNCPHIINCVPSVCEATCSKHCPYGFEAEGCPRCTCASDPCLHPDACLPGQTCTVENAVSCPFLTGCKMNKKCLAGVCAETCQKYCPYGFLEEGCPRCQCAPDPCPSLACGVNERCVTNPGTCVHGQCPHIGNCVASVCAETCDKYCPYGFLEDGCPRCQCTPDPCQTVTCIGNNRCVATPGTCVHGKCPHIGNCEPSVCPPVCSRHCPYGFLEEGCPRCTCAPNPCDINQCPASEDCFTQEGLCVSGNNCPHIINCVPSVCEATCSKHCPYGFEAEGCPRCTCASDPCLHPDACLPGQTCTVENAVLCPFLTGCKMNKKCLAGVCDETCTKYCPYGFLSAGCPRCTCSPNPCLDHQCPLGEECVAQVELCMFSEGCPHRPICKLKACEEVSTGSNCRYGYLPNKCPRCDCAPDPCPNITCGNDQTCITIPSQCEFRTGCPALARCVMSGNVCEQCCDKRCPFGFTLRGCPRCECAPDPCQGVACGPGKFCEASPSTCGFRDQCPHTAVCRPRPQVCEATCKTYCPYGFVSEGCPRCTCQTDPCLNTSCQAGEVCRTTPSMCRFTTMCPHKAVCVPENSACPWTCWRWCPFGFLTSGCPRCECAPDPCENMECGPNEGCVPRPSTCPQLWGCPFDAVCIPAPFNKCFQQQMSGSCNQSIPGYYYDPHMRDCRSFRYTGCGGNDNRFLHQSTCKRSCNAVGYKFRRNSHNYNLEGGYSRHTLHGLALGMDAGAGESSQPPIAEWTIDIPMP